MQTINFGNTGLRVSRLCLGCMSYGSPGWRDWVLDENASMPFFARAFELGINFFDTADVYSLGESERILGRAMRAYGARREDVVIATKVFFPMGAGDNNRGLSRKHIMHAIDESLRRLGTDYVDVYQIQRIGRINAPFRRSQPGSGQRAGFITRHFTTHWSPEGLDIEAATRFGPACLCIAKAFS